jgi:predicted CoA-binding protein
MSARGALMQVPLLVAGHGGERKRADAILAALSAAGYAVVPREPTQAMNIAAAQLDWSAQDDPTWTDIYRAMIAAAEKEPQG